MEDTPHPGILKSAVTLKNIHKVYDIVLAATKVKVCE